MIIVKWLLLFLFISVAGIGQEKKLHPTIERALQEIKDFNQQETSRDSVNGHWLGSNTEDDFLRRYSFYKKLHEKLNAVQRSSMTADDLVNLDLLLYSVKDEISLYQFKSYLNPILADEGFHTGLAHMAGGVLVSKKDFADYTRRLNDIPRFVDEHIALMRRGLALGISQPAVILNGYQHTYEQHIVNTAEQSVFWKPFLQRPYGLADEEWKQIVTEGKAAITNSAIAGFRRIKLFFDKEYLPATRKTIGVSHFPDGLAYYQDRASHYTTTDLSYEEIYELGLREVARIKKEMHEVMQMVQFKGNLQEFITSLRTDKRFYASTPDQLLKEASFIAKKADGVLPRFFGHLPRQPYGVEAVPAHLAPTYTAGRYAGASLSSKKAGFYWVNTYNLESRPLYALEALTLHEAMPGHHLQIALTSELTHLPDFRRSLYVNAFGEGWGLYCEHLGTEMGFYQDPYSRFGKLTYEMWRASRLVLDVALHTKGWTREQAVNYLADNTALSLHEVNTEINRYISWPGQALAYKMGELKIKELRKRSEEKLKDKFDIREFHDLVLSQGTVTLQILEQMVNKYIADRLQ